jgi:nitrogen fixation NifU-like protein
MNPSMPSAPDPIDEILRDGENLGEMPDADAVGTAGSEDCGDMLRMWVKFKEENGRKVIDRASFQTFGCQTALAVATVAARMLRGRTAEEALSLHGQDLAAPLGPLPPMKIHCAQLVEDALHQALRGEPSSSGGPSPGSGPSVGSGPIVGSARGGPVLAEALQSTTPAASPKKIVFKKPPPAAS